MDIFLFLRRRGLHFCTIVLLLLTVLVPMFLNASGWIETASAQAALPQPPASASSGSSRFTPSMDTTAPTPQVSSWTPKTSTKKPVKAGTSAASTTGATSRKPGEQVDLRTATTSTYLNANGTWTLKEYSVPVHYQDATGAWKNIDPSVVSDTSDSGYALGNKANGWHVHFAHSTGSAKLLHVQFPGVTVSDTLEGAAKVTATTSANQVVYPGVFPNVNLQYVVGNSTLDESLLLQNAQVPASFTFTYHVPGATAHEDAGGNIIFTDSKGNVLFVLGAAVMYEADAAGQPLPTAAGGSVSMSLSGSGPQLPGHPHPRPELAQRLWSPLPGGHRSHLDQL